MIMLTVTLLSLGVASVQSNGTVGQFAKRSHDSKTKVPYPPHEDKIEQERLATSFVDMVGELPRYLQGIGNPPAEEAVCKCSHHLSSLW